MLRTSILRAASSTPSIVPTSRLAARTAVASANCQQSRKAHAISNPTLSNIESRWESMPLQEQADLWMQLRDRMKGDWHELTLNEKKAAYWIAFGPHGPRSQPAPGENLQVAKYVLYGIGAATVIFMTTRYFAKPQPKTMTKEWQEASNEYLKEQGVEPITGFAAEGYKGKGMVQSKPLGKPLDELNEE